MRCPQGTVSRCLDPELTDPDTRRLIDFSSLVAVLMLVSLHFPTDADSLRAILRPWRETMRLGGSLAISHITADDVEPATAKAAQDVYADASAPAVPCTLAEVGSLFNGVDLGTARVDIDSWPVPVPQYAAQRRVPLYGGVGGQS